MNALWTVNAHRILVAILYSMSISYLKQNIMKYNQTFVALN